MYADRLTPSMEYAIGETERRRNIQKKYNEQHGIIPRTVTKKVSEILEISTHKEDSKEKKPKKRLTAGGQRQQMIEQLTREMKAAAKLLEFEHAAHLRDKIKQLQGEK